jgi:hypothetical protein
MNWKGCEGILASFKVIFQHLPEGTERNYGKPPDSRSAGRSSNQRLLNSKQGCKSLDRDVRYIVNFTSNLDLGTEKILKSECAENELLVTYFSAGWGYKKRVFCFLKCR